MTAAATTVDAYLSGLPDDKRDMVAALRTLVHDHLPEGWVETINWGMISYEIPMERTGKTYNGKPLMFAAIGAQKNHVGLYLCGLYCMPDRKEAFETAWRGTGKKLDMGKSCLRLKKPEDIDRDAIALALGAATVEEFIAASKR